MTTTNMLAVQSSSPEHGALMQVSDVKFRLDAVQQLMREVMMKGPQGDYGIIPGTGDKPTLLKPGAEKLCTLFRLSPTYDQTITDLGKGHREYVFVCTLTHIPTGRVWGQGIGSCSTMESKYRWRKGQGENTGNPVPKAYWDAKKTDPVAAQAMIGGKGFRTVKVDGNWMIFQQTDDRVENADIADVYNTVLKMATKRALVAAVLITTGASSLFTQDLDDNLPAPEGGEETHTTAPARVSSPKSQAAAAPAPVGDPSKCAEFVDRIATIEEKKGTNAKSKKPWTMWSVTTITGTVLATFSETIEKQARTAMLEGVDVRIQWTDDGKGAKIDAILPVEAGEYVGEVVE